MPEKSPSGSIFGVPYNFDRPSMRRLLSAYWKPGEGMLTEKPFGVGYTLNLANWRSWLVVAIAAALVWQERKQPAEREDEEAVEVLVDE